MPNIKVAIQYDGTDFHGWQIQPGLRTVQGCLADALRRLSGEKVKIIGAGRTDAGAHALGQIANFHLEKEFDVAELQRALNSLLPWDVRIVTLSHAPDRFHARRDARSKLYRYQIYTGPVISPFAYRYYLHFPRSLDIEKMEEAAEAFIGAHDFTAFAASASSSSNRVRTVFRSELARAGRRLFYLIEADGFLQHMVRSIVGTLIEVGLGRIGPDEIELILRSRERARAGPTVAARGLFLVRVNYRPIRAER